MRAEAIDETGLVRLRISDRLDVETSETIEEEADHILADGVRILLLFEPRAFIDSHGVRVLVQLTDRANETLGEPGLAIVSESRAADQVFEITRLGRRVPVLESEEDAIDLLTQDREAVPE